MVNLGNYDGYVIVQRVPNIDFKIHQLTRKNKNKNKSKKE